MSSTVIHVADESDIPDLVTLMRAYCDDSDEPHVAKPNDQALIALCHNVLSDPEKEGIHLLARRSDDNRAIGFASLFWSWSFVPKPGRRALLSDLFVDPSARGSGLALSLIQACQDKARQHDNVYSIIWQTASDNHRAQAVYHRLGVQPRNCVDYELLLH